MKDRQTIRCEVDRQRGRHTAFELILGGEAVKDGVTLSVSEQTLSECRYGRVDLRIENEELSVCDNLSAETPLRVFLPLVESPLAVTALYMFSSWWSRPAFVKSVADIPDKTQIALFRFADRYACFLPMVGERCKAYLTGGTQSELQLIVTALYGGLSELHEPLYLYAEAQTVDEAVTAVFAQAAKLRNIRKREQRRLPEMFRWLGWCSWNAFYTDVNERGIRDKAAELAEKQVPVKWMIIDDGWLSLKDRLLYEFQPDREKFPEGFRKMTEDLHKSAGIEWFGVWHALMGYWSGIAPDSPVATEEAKYLCRTANGRLTPDPERGAGFYRDWYQALSDQGISFVKVDGQGTIPLCFENTLPLSEAAVRLHSSLENGASRFDGAVINCMGMAMENVLSRPATAVSRNSDDFFPDIDDSFKEHLLENAYNSLYHDKLYVCDWDMFWTKHPDSAKHALLRAISGGPVYCSDRVGETDPDVLRPLIYPDGELLMPARSARPTADCIFTDPEESGFLKLQNIAPFSGELIGGCIAVFSLTEKEISCSFSPAQVEGVTECDRYLVYDRADGSVRFVGREESVACTVKGKGYRFYVILPAVSQCTCLGLTEKYIGFAAVESIHNADNAQTVVLHAEGTVAFVSEAAPKRITVNGADMTDIAQRRGMMTVVPMPERVGRAVAVIEL